MGRLFSHFSRADLIRKLAQTEDNEYVHRETLKYTLRGNILWSVSRITAKQDQPSLAAGQSLTLICCDLLQRSGELWGYKSLSEADHPFYYTCPLGYLRLAPVFSADWREGVQAYHARQAARRAAR